MLEPKKVKEELHEIAVAYLERDNFATMQSGDTLKTSPASASPARWLRGVPQELSEELHSLQGWQRMEDDTGYKIKMPGPHPALTILDTATRLNILTNMEAFAQYVQVYCSSGLILEVLETTICLVYKGDELLMDEG